MGGGTWNEQHCIPCTCEWMKGFTDFVTLLPTKNCLNPLLVNTLITKGGAYSGLVGMACGENEPVVLLWPCCYGFTTSNVTNFSGKFAFFLSLIIFRGGIFAEYFPHSTSTSGLTRNPCSLFRLRTPQHMNCGVKLTSWYHRMALTNTWTLNLASWGLIFGGISRKLPRIGGANAMLPSSSLKSSNPASSSPASSPNLSILNHWSLSTGSFRSQCKIGDAWNWPR